MDRFKWLTKSLVIVAFVFAWVSFSAFSAPPAQALAHHQPTVRTHASTSNFVHPNCGNSGVNLNPIDQTVYLGNSSNITVNWYCAAYLGVNVNAVWGDGSASFYQCRISCEGGQVSMGDDHVYRSRGTFSVHIYLSGNSSGDGYATIRVI